MGMKRFFKKTWVKVTLIILAVLLALGGIAFWTFNQLFIPSVPAAEFAEPASQVEAYEQDLEYLALYPQLEKAFEDETKREAFADYLAGVREELDTMTPARFELVVARAVALADNGHSNVSAIGRTRRVNQLPVRFGPFEDGQFVLQVRKGHEELLGAELIAVEGRLTSDVVAAFLPYFGGVQRRSAFFSHLFITSPDLLHAEGFTAAPDAATLTFRLATGETVERRLEGARLDDGQRQPFGRELMDHRVRAADEDNWVHLMDGQAAPLYLAEPDEPYLYRRLEDPAGAYVKINYNWDIDGRSLTGWLKEVMADMRERQPAFAVVDLRFNGGGTDATARFAKELPSLVAGDGPIYVVTSRETFSAGIGAAAQIKQFAGDRARIVGGLVGDRLRFIANGGTPLVLPNSGIVARVWSTWEDYADGCWDWGECFWLSPFFREEGVSDLEPDIPVPLDFGDYVANRDAALEAIYADVRRLLP